MTMRRKERASWRACLRDGVGGMYNFLVSSKIIGGLIRHSMVPTGNTKYGRANTLRADAEFL